MLSLEIETLHSFLEDKVHEYNQLSFIESDPVSIPHLFHKKEDQEIAAFLTATLSWGSRKSIIRSSILLMDLLDRAPHQFIVNFSNSDLKPFRRFYYRTFNGEDCVYFLKALQKIYLHHGGLESVFSFTGDTNDQAKNAILNARRIFFSMPHQDRHEKHFSNPAWGSASKRLNMFLRWMVRKDASGVDLGIWRNISPAALQCPLDVHSGRVARKLGLLQRKQNDWKAVTELSTELRNFDPEDPAKYDFALFGLGVFERF